VATGVGGGVVIVGYAPSDTTNLARGNRFVRNVAAKGGGVALVCTSVRPSVIAKLASVNEFSGNRGGRYATVGRLSGQPYC